MAPSFVHLPNGQILTVTPVFGGLFFKSNDLSNQHSIFPAGWTIVLNSEDYDEDHLQPQSHNDTADAEEAPRRRRHIHRWSKPTLQNDHLFISSISNPSSADYQPPSSPTRQIAMMLWATLYWYFHQDEPDTRMTTSTSKNTADAGKPKGDWRVSVNREGIFKGRQLLVKLERMGLIASEDSSVGAEPDDRKGEGYAHMFVSRRSFWQLDARIYLYNLSVRSNSPFPSGSPHPSRPNSPNREAVANRESKTDQQMQQLQQQIQQGLWSPPGAGLANPFHSASHLPTYYPPPPSQFVFTNNIRHPMRPKPPRQGETFYTRYIPSVGQYLSFRVASLSPMPQAHHGPMSPAAYRNSHQSLSDTVVPTLNNPPPTQTDAELLLKWMNDPRVSHFWGEQGGLEHQEAFLKRGLESKHSFPAIGSWDGKPFGYFEIYWVKEDVLGKYMGGECGNYDRGFHCLVGEQEFRGSHRVKIWTTALVHYCLLADNRTEVVMLEPRVDNDKLKRYLEDVGFYKEKEISFPHKQANLMKIRRDAWEAPYL